MKRFSIAFALALSLVAAYLWHTAYGQGLAIPCTPAQAARYAFDRGATNPAQWGPQYIVITDDGKGTKLEKWAVPGVAAPANAGALPDAATAATWLATYQTDRSADSDNLSRKERAMITALVQLINQRVDPDITGAQLKAAYDTAYKNAAP